MRLQLSDERAREARDRLSPYARHALGEAARFAGRLHADEVTIEHVFSSLLFDEESAAAQVVLHAFADPETIATEMLALCPGITVVGSARCLPFSVRGVAALTAARASAAEEGAARVEPAHLLRAALGELPDQVRATLEQAGATPPPGPGAAPAGEAAVAAEGALFRSFSNASKRALSSAGHQAVRLERDAISPAHVALGCLEVDEDLRTASGLTASRMRLAVGPADADETPHPERDLPPSDELVEFLLGCEPDSDSLQLLGRLLDEAEPELRQLFTRQKVVSDVVDRCRGVLSDPPAPA